MVKIAHHIRIQGGNRQHCQFSVLALSAKEECFGVCQFAFKSSETGRCKNGLVGPTTIVFIPRHHALWLLTNGMPVSILA